MYSRVMFIAAVLAVLLPGHIWTYQLTILHTNDVHARFEEFNKYGGRCTESLSQKGECFGGVARQMSKVREIRETNDNVIFLNAGDYYQGTFMYTVHKWKIVADFMNRLGHDAMALGNHEFDDGVEGLLPFLENVNFPVLGCNIDVDEVPLLKGKILSSIERDVGGEKIGIIGYVTPDTSFLASPGNVSFKTESDCLKEQAEQLHSKGIKIIIALGHSGFRRDLEIARSIPYLDVVVGGHTDTFLYTGNPPSIEKPQGKYPVVIDKDDGSKTLVVQDYTYGKYLGFLRVKFTDDGKVQSWTGNPILLDEKVEEDPLIQNALKPYVEEVEKISKEVVGKSRVLLLGERSTCRMRECNMGNMLTDAVVSEFTKMPRDRGWTSVSVALWNSGGIRSSIDERYADGNITMEDLMNVIPFACIFLIVELKGSDLITAMEEAVENYDVTGVDPPGAFLQVSGMKIRYNLKKNPGERVEKILIKCSNCRVPKYFPLNTTSYYKVAIPDFIYNKGDGFKTFMEKSTSVISTGLEDSDIIKSYLRTSSPLVVGVEDRISFQDENRCLKSTNFQSSNRKVNTLLIILSVIYSYLR
ncbi:protein 5NUC-like [Centruroides sculpturatus]|uniref:protein 5NUC-like n=1 Tax=Centruroides sculpturatus TaxID=218467 RepID=UPI000C6E2DEC|nr:protein 5NUC-like [Centruroides sculpturatus]